MRIADCGLWNEKQGGIRDAECESPTPNSKPPIASFKGRSRTPHSHGFTLIEIVITIVLIGIISGIAAMIILHGAKIYSAEDIRSDVHYQARLAVERMAREARAIRSATAGDITSWTAIDLQFCDTTGKAVEFQLTGTSLQRRENPTCNPIVAGSWGGWNALSSQIDVASSSFVYYKQDGTNPLAVVSEMWFVGITVKSTSPQSSETLTIRTRVHPRNF